MIYDPECTHLVSDEKSTRIRVTCKPITYSDTLCNEMVDVGSSLLHCFAYIHCMIRDDSTHLLVMLDQQVIFYYPDIRFCSLDKLVNNYI